MFGHLLAAAIGLMNSGAETDEKEAVSTETKGRVSAGTHVTDGPAAERRQEESDARSQTRLTGSPGRARAASGGQVGCLRPLLASS